MDQKQTKSPTKITKVTLVIYCSLALVSFIVLIAIAPSTNYSYLLGFLLCLGPGLLFVFVSMLLPLSNLVGAKTGKGIIVWCVIAYILKYAAIIGIPFIGMVYKDIFNRWTMLATTLVAPILVIISKLIFANIVSKSSKTEQK